MSLLKALNITRWTFCFRLAAQRDYDKLYCVHTSFGGTTLTKVEPLSTQPSQILSREKFYKSSCDWVTPLVNVLSQANATAQEFQLQVTWKTQFHCAYLQPSFSYLHRFPACTLDFPHEFERLSAHSINLLLLTWQVKELYIILRVDVELKLSL